MNQSEEKESIIKIGDKMNFGRIVWWIVMFLVGFTYFMLVRFVRLPHLKVFIYALPPHGLWVGLYNLIKGILIVLFGFVIMFFAMCTAVDWIIGKIPIGFIRKLLRKIPPLPILKRFGIFDFIRGMWNAIVSTWPLKQRIKHVGITYANYIARNTVEFAELLKLRQRLDRIKTGFRNQATSVLSYVSPTTEPQSRQEMLQRNANVPEIPIFLNSQVRKIDDEYRQCMEENIISPSPEISNAEMKVVDSRNAINRIVCKSKYLASIIEEMRG